MAEKTFYTYMWLRDDGTPYYVGKGIGNRAFSSWNHHQKCPIDPSNIIIQEWPSEQEAFEGEKLLIAIYGRKDLGTGILRNLTDGGEGASGCIPSFETRLKMSAASLGHKRLRGKILSEETKAKIGAGNKGHKYRVGLKHTEETKNKIRMSMIGKNRKIK